MDVILLNFIQVMIAKKTLFFGFVVSLFFTFEQSSFGQDCQKYIATYKEQLVKGDYLKEQGKPYQDFYNNALSYWYIARYKCKNSTKTLYSDGVKLLKYKISGFQEKYVSTKSKKFQDSIFQYVDSINKVYDARIENFGEKPLVFGMKAADLLSIYPDSFYTSYMLLYESFTLDSIKNDPAILKLLIATSEKMAIAKKISASKFFNLNMKIKSCLVQMTELAPKLERLTKINSVLEYQEILLKSTLFLDCDVLQFLFYETNEAYHEVFDLYISKKCIKDDKFYDYLHDLWEESGKLDYCLELAAHKLKILDMDSYQNYMDLAIRYDTANAAKYYMELAINLFNVKNDYVVARKYANLAKKYDTNSGKPYLLIGKLYAKSSENCGSTNFDKQAVYWLAYDELMKATTDPITAKEANDLTAQISKQFPAANELHFRSIKEGDIYKIGCWINEETKVKILKKK